MSKEADAQSPAAPAKSKKMLFIIIAVLVVAGGGGGAYWKFFANSPEAAGAREPEKPAEAAAIISFDPFVVNLADPGSPRFLRVTLGLVVDGEAVAKEFAEDAVGRAKARSALIEMLSQQQASVLVTNEGKAALKKTIAALAEHSSEELKVHDVLFTEFIVQ